MQFYIKSAIFFCCVLGYPIPLTPLTKLVEDIGCTENTDECALGTDTCDDNAICRDTHCAFSCSCKDGYETKSGELEGHVCEDVNECDNDRAIDDGGNNCDNHATCTNTGYDPDTKKGFTCTCDAPLYHGNGIRCSDQDLYKVGDNCGFAGCTCPTGYVPTRQDVSVESQSDCQTAAAFLGITAENSCDPEEEDITAENYCHYDEIAYSNNSTRPKGCYHSCKNNKLYIAKNPSARTNYRTSRKNPVLADPSEDCDSYIRLHLCQSKYL